MLAAANLTRRFGDRLAVDNVSLDLRPGEIFALLGPNGAGKTTTLRMLSGLIAPTSGAVRIGGEVLDARNAARLRARVGFLTESPGLWDRLTVHENLMTYARLYGLPRPGEAVDAALEAFDVRDRAGDAAAQLSKGLKQRVALARTLLHGPDIVLLDEPTSGLDPESARTVRELIIRMRDDRHAVLLSTHNLDEVERIATRVAVLRTSLIAVGTPAALAARLFGSRVRVEVRSGAGRLAAVLEQAGMTGVQVHEDVLYVPLGRGPAERRPSAIDTPAIVRLLVQNGAEIESVAPEQPTLEDVYLRLLRDDEGAGA
jgi:ABC-2 type transport system ATP-binding protein